MERRYLNLHNHVVKCARWAAARHDATVFASVGNTGEVQIADTRLPDDAAVASISTPQGGQLHSVVWHPDHEYTLATTGRSPHVNVYDLRQGAGSGSVVHSLSGHCGPTVTKCARIYRPAFVQGGDGSVALAVSGYQSRKIVIFDLATANIVSKGDIGYDALNMVWSSETKSLLTARGRQVERFVPV